MGPPEDPPGTPKMALLDPILTPIFGGIWTPSGGAKAGPCPPHMAPQWQPGWPMLAIAPSGTPGTPGGVPGGVPKGSQKGHIWVPPGSEGVQIWRGSKSGGPQIPGFGPFGPIFRGLKTSRYHDMACTSMMSMYLYALHPRGHMGKPYVHMHLYKVHCAPWHLILLIPPHGDGVRMRS